MPGVFQNEKTLRRLRRKNDAENRTSELGCEADFKNHLRLQALVAGGWEGDRRKVPHEGLFRELELETGEEHAEDDL